MESVIIVAGKGMPDVSNLTDGISLSGRRIVATSVEAEDDSPASRLTAAERKNSQTVYEREKAGEAEKGFCVIKWNKASFLSARSLVLQTVTILGKLDETLLYFDEEWYASKAEKMDSEEVSRSCDEMIAGYQYLTLEVLSLFKKRAKEEGPGRLIFLLKETPSRLAVLRTPSLRDGLNVIASPIVSAGKAAFASFAENIAAQSYNSGYADVVLMRGDSGMDGFRRDDETGRWVCLRLKELASAPAEQEDAKTDVSWITPEAKNVKQKKWGFLKWT